MKRYIAVRGWCMVDVQVEHVRGGILVRDPLSSRLDLANHSPTGFEWGYGGSGPAQLALALLANATSVRTALRYYQQFKWDVVARLPHEGWTLEASKIRSWVAAKAAMEPLTIRPVQETTS